MELVLKKCRIDNEFERVQLQKEIQIHSAMKHPRVISFYGYFYDSDGSIYIILEHAKGGDVWQMITDSQPTEQEFMDRVMRPMVCALMHMHSLGIVHRDIKPENIFLTEKRNGAKLGDFGFAVDEKTLKINRLGTMDYMAPEILLCDTDKRKKARSKNQNLYDSKVDCWALGVLAYEGIVGTTPWDSNGTMEEYAMNIIKNPFIEHPGISKDVNDFIGKCLQINPKNRISTIEMLAHPCIQGSICTTHVKSSSVQNLRANTFQNGTYSLYPQHRKNDEQNERGNTVMNGLQIPGREEFMDVTVRNGTAFASGMVEEKEQTFKGCLPNIFSRKNDLKK
jgi:serine/threonine protein kinase